MILYDEKVNYCACGSDGVGIKNLIVGSIINRVVG